MDILQKMTLDQIRAVVDVLQKSTDSYLYILDFDADIYMISERLKERFPFATTIMHNATLNLKRVIYPADFAKVDKNIKQCASGELDIHSMEYRWLDRKNKVVWIDCRGAMVTGPDNHRMLIGRIMELGRKAKADNVTGLRKEERLRLDLEAVLRDAPESINYIMRIGIDNFKEINEKEGVGAGDAVLIELSECMMDIVDKEVDIYRLVADEFIIVDTTPDFDKNAETVYEQLRKEIESTLKKKEYNRFYTVSAGIITNGFAGRTADEILRLSEFALNEAKRNGKNQMIVFDEEAYAQYLKHLDIRKMLRKDVNNQFEGFQVFYQPIVSTKDYSIIGAEALLRWKSEKYGNVSPAEFIPILEESGLIIPVGRYVMWEAATACREWQKLLPQFHVNINLSYIQIHKSDLMQDVERCIQEVGISPQSLVLELTESGYIETDTRIRELFKELKSKKVDLALDDFGTGYSNMRYLKEIEADTVKIDRSFVVQALQNDHDYSIINYIIKMVHSLGYSVCMEGIEKKEELDKMMKTNPDMIQGYYFGKPSPKEVFEKEYIHKEVYKIPDAGNHPERKRKKSDRVEEIETLSFLILSGMLKCGMIKRLEIFPDADIHIHIIVFRSR